MQVASNSSQHVELMLQEGCTDQSSSLVVYSTIEVDAIQLAMSGEDPSRIPILPLGFVIVPVELSSDDNATANGSSPIPTSGTRKPSCLLTVGLQVLVSTIPSAKLSISSVTAIHNHLNNTVQQVLAALGGGTSTAACTNNGGSGSSSGADPGATTTSTAGPK